MPTVIPAGHPGKCGICGKDYPIDTRIAKDAKTGKWCEANCLWPGRAGSKANADSNSTPGADGGSRNSKVAVPDDAPITMTRTQIEALSQANLDCALADVKLKLKIPEGAQLSEEQIALVREQSHQQHALTYLMEEQRFKAYNSRRWRG